MVIRRGELSYVRHQIFPTPDYTGVDRVPQENVCICSSRKLHGSIAGDFARFELDLCPEGKQLCLVEVLSKPFMVR
jgi:hypothetical protein